jgi:hypothetical protein
MILAALRADGADSVLTGVWLVVVIAATIALAALFVAAAVSVVRSPRLTSTGRVLWIVALLVFPLLGPVVWFLVGRRSTAQVYR